MALPLSDREFELAFQDFLTKGGFTQPCLREDLERTQREIDYKQLQAGPQKLCPHGNRPLRCSKCYFAS